MNAKTNNTVTPREARRELSAFSLQLSGNANCVVDFVFMFF